MGVFGSMTSTLKTTMGLLRAKLSLHRQTVVSIETLNSFGWWAKHEQQFSNTNFFVRQFLGIIDSYIETERIFSMAEIITGFWGNIVLALKIWTSSSWSWKIGLMILDWDVCLVHWSSLWKNIWIWKTFFLKRMRNYF